MNQMSKSSSRLIHGFIRHHNYTQIPKPSSPNSTTAATLFRDSLSRAHHSGPAPTTRFGAPSSFNAVLTRIASSPKHKFDAFSSKAGLGLRFFSFRSSGLGKANTNGNFAKKVFYKPATAVASTFSRYREAIGLQIEAFFKRNYLVLLGA